MYATKARNICHNLKDIYAPEGFNPESTVLACGFPSTLTELQCRDFMSWIAPVVYVAKTISIGDEANFLIVFASQDHARMASRYSIPFDKDHTEVVCRIVDKKPTLWDSVVSNFYSTSKPVHGAFPLTGTPSMRSPYINTSVETNQSNWDSIMSNEGVKQVTGGAAAFGSNLMAQAGEKYGSLISSITK